VKEENATVVNPRYQAASFILRQTNDGFTQVFKDEVKKTLHDDGFFNHDEERENTKTGLETGVGFNMGKIAEEASPEDSDRQPYINSGDNSVEAEEIESPIKRQATRKK